MISFSGVWVKLAHVDPTAAAFYRGLFGGIVLMALVWSAGRGLPRGIKFYLITAAAGLLLALDLTLWHRSVFYIGPGLATILANFQVFFLAAYGILILGERLTLKFALSVPLSLLGLMLLVGLEWRGLGPLYRTGLIFGLLAALAYSAYLLTLRQTQTAGDRQAPITTMAVVSLSIAFFSGLEVPLLGESFRIPDLQTWIVLIAYGICAQVLGWVLISKGLRSVEASRAGLVLLLQPALAFIWDVVFFGRSASFRELMGAGLAIGAIYLGASSRTITSAQSSEGRDQAG